MSPQEQQVLQSLRNSLGQTVVTPERGIVALRQHVVELEEIDDPAPTIVSRRVEARSDDVHDFAADRHLFGDELGRHLDEHDRGRLERLEETGRHADGDAISFPEGVAVSGPDRDLAYGQILAGRTDIAT